jgi:very-short-patch-repair endonuclease
LQQAGIASRFQREYVFAPPRRWRFDFADVALKIGLECDGGTWVQGRHSRGSGIAKDNEKMNMAALIGWKVFRFDGNAIKDGTALRWVHAALGRFGIAPNKVARVLS